MNVAMVPYKLVSGPALWVIAANVLALVAFVGSPYAAEYPAAGLSILAFLCVQLLCPACRPCLAAPLCPANIAQGFFWIQLVLVPLLIGFCDVSLGTLPMVPTNHAMETAICLRILAYISFSVAYQWFAPPAGPEEVSNRADSHTWMGDTRLLYLIAGFAVLGLVGCFMFYRGINGFIDYVSSPLEHHERELKEVTLAAAAGNLLRPFLGFAIVLAWSFWMSRPNRPSSVILCLAGTGMAAVFVLFANFTYNRGTTLAPVMAMAAAYSLHVGRISFKVVALATFLALAAVIAFGSYRSTNMQISDLSADDISATWNDQHVVEFVQIYASGPQLTAHLIDHAELEGKYYFGKTLLSSILYPIPVVGKPYRETSGVVAFNQSIYGDVDVNDQIIAYDSELFINFHIPGVILGYVLLGGLLAFFQRRFLAAASPVESYIWLLLGLWTIFPGSFAVTSQSYVYSFWPIYAYALIKWLCGNPKRERAPVLAHATA